MRFIKFFFLVAALYFIADFCKKKTDDFTLANTRSDRPYENGWEIHASEAKKDLDSIAGQKFTYFGKGAQAYIFFSADNRYVIKLPRQDRYQPPFWVKLLPPISYKIKKLASAREKLERDFTSYKIAFDRFQKETGLIFVHLNKSTDLQKKITLVDRLNIEHEIDLDRVEFILQKRAELVYPKIKELMAQGDVGSAKAALSSLSSLFKARREKGIDDKEPNIGKNFGFIGTDAIQIDIGRFSLNAPDQIEIPNFPASFTEWLSSNYPQLSEEIRDHLAF